MSYPNWSPPLQQVGQQQGPVTNQWQHQAYTNQQVPELTQQQNNWFNSAINPQTNRNPTQQQWQQVPQQQPPLTNQIQPPGQYQRSVATPQQNQHYYQQQQALISNASVLATQQNFIKTEQMASTQVQNSDSAEGWNDWGDWNDNNQPTNSTVPQSNNYQNYNQNVIAESFSNEANDNWNWNVEEKPNTSAMQPPPLPSQQQSTDNLNHNSIKISPSGSSGASKMQDYRQYQQPQEPTMPVYDANMVASGNQSNAAPTRIPDDNRNTQFVTNPLVTRVKKEHQLTPQWSTESQMSNTSSERSGESNDLDSRSTNTSDDPNLMSPSQGFDHNRIVQQTNFFSQVERNVSEPVGDLDSLDQAIMGFTQQSPNPQEHLQQASMQEGTANSNQHLVGNKNLLTPSAAVTPQQAGKSPAYYTPPTTFGKQSDFITPPTSFAQQSYAVQSPPLPEEANQQHASSHQGIKSAPVQVVQSVKQLPPSTQTVFSTVVGNQVPDGSRLASILSQQLPETAPVNSVYVSQAKPVAQPARQYAMTPALVGQAATPYSGSNSNAIDGTLPPPPPAQTPPQQIVSGSALPPPPAFNQGAGSNPYKRAGVAQHHRGLIAPPVSKPNTTPTAFYAPPPPEEFQQPQNVAVNQECLAPDNSEVITEPSYEVENMEVAPNNDRNQYLQTGHLSEDGYNSSMQHSVQQEHRYNEVDNFPPPGLSRLVLGQPESDVQQNSNNQPEIPPGLDRMVPGTELNSSDLNMERQADGQDTIPPTRSAFTAAFNVEENDSSSNIDITADRNLYHVPGESDVHEHRVVTGNENGLPMGSGAGATEQREVELDGENLEDQQLQQNHQHAQFSINAEITREEPIEGANTLDEIASSNVNHETESSLTVETNRKDLSNPSTCNDDSDNRGRHVYLPKGENRRSEEKRKRGEKDKRKERYETEESDYSSDRERRRYREGSVRGDREKDRDRDRRDKREGSARDRDRYMDDNNDNRRNDRDRPREKYDRGHGGRYNNRYETDSKYETEGSTKNDRRRPGEKERDRTDRDRENDYGRREDKNRRVRRDRYEREERDRDRDRRRGEFRDDRDRKRSDRDYREKHRNDYDDDYRRSGSRNNARDSDREKDRSSREKEHQQRYQQQNYGYPAGYGYDAYTYYQQQQQYYEKLRRTNPQAYMEWYRKYFEHMQTSDLLPTDGRDSVHSGRSSANNEKERPDNYDTSLNLVDGASSIQDPHRLTPCKFTIEHSTVSLANGLLVCVKPKYSVNGIANVVKVLKLGANDSSRRLFQSFPGPLVRGITHKKTIIEFCEDQIRMGPPSGILKSRQNSVSSVCSLGQANKASFTLMWNLLILLLRQNGVVVGTDIAELLMKNKNQYPYELQTALKSSNASRRDSVQSDLRKHKENQTPSEGDGQNREESNEDRENIIEESSEIRKEISEEEITEKFRNYLLYGNVNEALEWATENNLWGHALFLASKVDRRSHANVLMKFANKLVLNDPLQTLYQLMSGRTPSSVTSVQDEKWGDWRPHLAMILSNTSQRPELNRKAITTLGDSLYNRGDLFGAQFCYLMAQVGFGRYSSVNQESNLMSNSTNAVRLVLLGSSHHKTFREFATNEAIIMTEIYEYACALNDEKFSIVEFQPYKYLLATRMLDYGFQLKTLMYMEQISLHVQLDPSKYEASFIEKVYKLADQLKFYDPVLEKTLDDHQDGVNQHWEDGDGQAGFNEEQKWLQNLRNVLSQFHSGNLANDVTIPQNVTAPNGYENRSHIDQQFVEINQQFSELALQYNNFEPLNQNQQQSQPPALYSQSPMADQYQQQTPLNQSMATDSMPPSINQYEHQYDGNQGLNSMQGQDTSYASGNYGQYSQQQLQQQQQQQQGLPQQQQQQNYDQSQNYGQDQSYDYWNQSQSNETPKPTISLPNSKPNKSAFYDDAPGSENLSANGESAKKSVPENANTGKKPEPKVVAKSSSTTGWFGDIWNKLSLKPKNQMILPDDKNPTIVWDPDKKRWVNTDGDGVEEESFKPPPKMAELKVSQIPEHENTAQPLQMMQQQPPAMQHQSQTQQQSMYGLQPQDIPMMSTAPLAQSSPNPMSASSNNNPQQAVAAEPAKTPSLQSNMFKMQRNRTLKKSYVDVFNPSGAAPSKPVEPVLAPTLPTAVPQTGFFIPAPVSNDDSQQLQQQQQQDGTPQFYNPNQYVGGYQQ